MEPPLSFPTSQENSVTPQSNVRVGAGPGISMTSFNPLARFQVKRAFDWEAAFDSPSSPNIPTGEIESPPPTRGPFDESRRLYEELEELLLRVASPDGPSHNEDPPAREEVDLDQYL